MKRTPGARRTSRLINSTLREARSTVKEINRLAAKVMARGDYAEAAVVAEQAKSVKAFEERLGQLRNDWRALWQAPDEEKASLEKTPLWQYYKPILQSLVALDGAATLKELVTHFEANFTVGLKPGDLKPVGRKHVPRWKQMVRHARKPMIQNKYIEDVRSKEWRVTSLGREFASK